MTLYLSRLCLNPLFSRSIQLAGDPYALHQKLLPTLPCRPREKPNVPSQPKTADLLFRVDETENGPVVLTQTTVEPDWTALELAPRALLHAPETKPYSPVFAVGQRLCFRLLARPSKRCSNPFCWWSPRLSEQNHREIRRGQRYAIRDDEELIHWLHSQGKGHPDKPGLNGFDGRGFVVESVGITRVRWKNTKPLNVTARQYPLGAVRFDGVLVVADPAKFQRTVKEGIGTQKAFGFGLLSLAPAP